MRWGISVPTVVLAAAFVAGACGNDWAATIGPYPNDAGDGDGAFDGPAPIDDTPYCTNGQANVAYPDRSLGTAIGQTLADATFTGESGPIALHDLFEPCADKSRLIVFRVSAGWCGTCRWHAAHTASAVPADVADRVELVDLLVASDANLPPTTTDLATWKTRIDAPQKLALDPAFTFGAVPGAPMPLPLYVLVDSRTMTIRNYANDPDPETLTLRIHQEIAGLDHAKVPVASPPKVYDGLFTQDRWDLIHDMAMPGNPPADPTNAKADDPLAAGLGQEFFSDASLSPSGTISCATCHDPNKGFSDGKPVAIGVATGDRNTPSLLLSGYSPWQFWDGRADSLWAQALGPIENAKEFASSRLFVAHAIAKNHASTYQVVFGAPPDLSDASRFPASGKPGDASWDAMTPADQTTVTTMVVN
ncbi:MAG TPA: cytochrome-c peroxidase, partial [Polyangiaceae bacterium]